MTAYFALNSQTRLHVQGGNDKKWFFFFCRFVAFLPHVFHPCAAACWSVLVGVTSSAPAHTQRVVRASDATVIHLHTYTFTHTQTHTYMYVYTHTHVCPHIQIYTHIHTLFLHSYIHTFLHPHTKLSKSV